MDILLFDITIGEVGECPERDVENIFICKLHPDLTDDERNIFIKSEIKKFKNENYDITEIYSHTEFI